MMRKILFLALFGAGFPLISQAAIISGWGVATSNSTASNCPSFCSTQNGGDFAYASAGGEFNPIAASSETSYAFTQAQAALNGNGFLPVLRSQASADVRRGGFSTAFGVQGYTYQGASATTLQLDLNLSGSTGDNNNGAYASNTIRADVGVVKASQIDFISHFATLMFEAVNRDDIVDIVNLFFAGATGSISLDLNPGDDYFVVASLQTNSKNGFASSFNTLDLLYLDAAGQALTNGQLGGLGLAPITGPLPIEPVPEPAMLALFLPGLLGMMGWRKFARV